MNTIKIFEDRKVGNSVGFEPTKYENTLAGSSPAPRTMKFILRYRIVDYYESNHLSI